MFQHFRLHLEISILFHLEIQCGMCASALSALVVPRRKPHPFHYFLWDSTSFLRFPEANEVGRWKMRYRYKFDEVGKIGTEIER